MKKLILAVSCLALVFAGYRIVGGTRSIERRYSQNLPATTYSAGPMNRIPEPADQPEEMGSGADAQIFLVGTLVALAIVAALPPHNNARHRSDVISPGGGLRPSTHRP